MIVYEQRYPLTPLPYVAPKRAGTYEPAPAGFYEVSPILAASANGTILMYTNRASFRDAGNRGWLPPAVEDLHPFRDALGQLDQRIRMYHGNNTVLVRKSLIMAHWHLRKRMPEALRQQLLPGAAFCYTLNPRTGEFSDMHWRNQEHLREPEGRRKEKVTLRVPGQLVPLMMATELVSGHVIPMLRPDTPECGVTAFQAGTAGRPLRVPKWVTPAKILYLVPRLPEAYLEFGYRIDPMYYRDMLAYSKMSDNWRDPTCDDDTELDWDALRPSSS